MPIRLIFIEDHPVVVSGVKAALQLTSEVTLVGVAGSIGEARTLLADVEADVALLDIRLPDALVFDLLGELSARGQPRTIIYSAFDSDGYVAAAIQRGASGFILKTAPLDELVETIRRVAAGTYAILDAPDRPSARSVELTSRERSLVRLLLDGRSNAEIASALELATNSVEHYLSQLYERFDVRGRVDLIVRAAREGWLDT